MIDFSIPTDLQPIVIMLGGVVLVMIITAIIGRILVRAMHRLMAKRSHELDQALMRARWKRIKTMIDRPDAESDRLAVIEADNLLDFVLKAMHMPGETMAFRLKFAERKFYELKRVRWCHSMRNKVVHEPDFRLAHRQAAAAVKEYERALRLLAAI
ncbi:MAG: hypothetical protein AAB429_00655 [Patescibacteria group bacterium]